MRYTTLLSAILVAGTLITATSCSKGAASLPPAPFPPDPITFDVEYRIQGFDEHFTAIRYIDSDGSSVALDDPQGSFGGGSRTIRVTKPFTAQLEVSIFNPTFSTLEYTLLIYVDGSMETIKQISVPPFMSENSVITVSL